MTVEVEFLEDYSGDIIDVVPADFDISNLDPPAEVGMAESGAAKFIVWSGEFHAGETASFFYNFDAPDTSPQFYIIGPLQVGDAYGRSPTMWRRAIYMAGRPAVRSTAHTCPMV